MSWWWTGHRGQFDANCRVRRHKWGKSVLKDAPRACEAVDAVLDNFNVHVPIPSKVPPAGTERERVQREREILGLKHDSQGERHRHPQSRFALFNVAGAVPDHPPLIWPTDYRRWTRPRTCTARRTSGCSQRTSPRRRRTRSACAGVRATARGDGKAVQYRHRKKSIFKILTYSSKSMERP